MESRFVPRPPYGLTNIYRIKTDLISSFDGKTEKDVSNGDDEYTINPEAYIHFEELKAQLEKGENEEIDLDKIGKAFEGYYDYRVNNLSENTRGDDGELEI